MILDPSSFKVLRNIPEPIDTVLFLGAGASKPFGYPTSDEFMRMLELDEEEEELVRESGAGTIDDLMRFCQKLTVGREESQRTLDNITRAKVEKLRSSLPEESRDKAVEIVRNIPKGYGERLNRASSIREKMIEGIFREYSYRHITDNYLEKYIQILRKRNGDHLPIFTTNYDPVVESLELGGKYEVSTLFTHPIWRAYQWEGQEAFDSSRKNVIHLFKLHGSVFWYWEESRLFEERTLIRHIREEIRREEIIPPGMEVGRDRIREPYSTYWDYFDAYLTQAKNAIFLGYRFDDGEILGLLKERPLDKIILVNPERVRLENTVQKAVYDLNKPAQEAVGDVEAVLETPAE